VRYLLSDWKGSGIFFTDEIETWALDDIHLEINEGEYVAIAGPSGCGKSTLLSVLGLLNSCTDGKVFLANEDVAQLSQSRQAQAARLVHSC